jgi:hypothetical protein
MIPYAATVVARAVYEVQQKRAILARMKRYQKENVDQLTGKTAKSE